MNFKLTAMLGAAALAAASQAQATVATVARASDNGSADQTSAGYNATYDTAGNRILDSSLGATHVQAFGGNCDACTGSSTGTMTPGTNATASFVQANISILGGAVLGGAFARADLKTGQLGVSAFGQTYPFDGFTSAVGGQALGGLFDGLNFSVAGAGANTVTDIGVTLDLHGAITNAGFLQEQLAFNSPGVTQAQILVQITGTAGQDPVISFSNASGWVSASFSPDTPDDLVFHGVYALTGSSQHVDIGDVLYNEAFNGSSDYAHTSEFSLSLPSNVTFTSDSGVFLSGGVPEPATWAMMLVGFGGLGAAIRARRKPAAATA